MKNLIYIILLIGSVICIEKKIPPNSGRVCGFGDFNNDRYTDIVVQRGKNLTILLYNDNLINVLEEGVFNNASTFPVVDNVYDTVECALGDFNGDGKLDILVSQKVKKGYNHTLYFKSSSSDEFVPYAVDFLGSQAMAVDVNGDGQHDILGFNENGRVYCKYVSGADNFFVLTDCSQFFPSLADENSDFQPYPGLPHLYVDILGQDLYAKLVFMGKKNDNLKMHVFKRIKDSFWSPSEIQITELDAKHIGAPIPGDFNADSKIEILVPICQDSSCDHISYFAAWQQNMGWRNVSLDLTGYSVVSEQDSKVIFRVGDFTLDGFPDLIATMADSKGGRSSRIIENLPCSHCEGNDTRKFEVRKAAFIQPKEVSLSVITMSAFFDLKEDGSLDILVEYLYDGHPKFSFIPCDDKGDTTFLKVQVFTNCMKGQTCITNGKNPGTGISWGGSCMSFTMSDGWGGSLESAACQQPAQTHRSLMAPYVLFGLGRSPNFVDELKIGAPRYDGKMDSAFRKYTQKQIVPNSRIIIMPPMTRDDGWTSRLYVTPSTLILQSLFVITVVCLILLLVVTCFHLRERKADRVERQQQSQRFHFDAM